MSVILFSLIYILYVWVLYPLILKIIALVYERKYIVIPGKLDMPVSIIIAAHNEEANIKARISNILESNYPNELIEVVIASDGSTDATVDLVRKYNNKNIKVFDIQPQSGRAVAHNKVVEQCSGEIIIFSDADTSFDKDFIKNIVRPFSDECVGFVSGKLIYENADSNVVSTSAGIYWRFEMFLRTMESKIGIYAFGSGACCAVKKELFKVIPATGDVDFTTPIDVVLAGKKCVHVNDALAYDKMPSTPGKEFKARVRMTSKNLHGTISRWGLKGLLRPVYTLVIVSHKLGRWMTPFALVALLIGSIANYSNFAVGILLLSQTIFYVMALAGYLRINIPLAGSVYSFVLANAAFFLGVLKAVSGNVPKSYKPVSQ